MVAPAAPLDDSAMRRLNERIARALGHDLRTPLGTITNYAFMLEGEHAPEGAALRDAAARIRGQAAGIAEAAQLLSDSLKIVTQPAERRSGEPVALLRALAQEIGAGVTLRVLDPGGARAPGEIAVDPRLVAFAWRAFLSIERGVRTRLPAEAQLRVARDEGHVAIELGFDGALDEAPPFAPIAEWMSGGAAKVPPLVRLALEVAGELLAVHGGALELAGVPGRRPALRLRIPPMAPAPG